MELFSSLTDSWVNWSARKASIPLASVSLLLVSISGSQVIGFVALKAIEIKWWSRICRFRPPKVFWRYFLLHQRCVKIFFNYAAWTWTFVVVVAFSSFMNSVWRSLSRPLSFRFFLLKFLCGLGFCSCFFLSLVKVSFFVWWSCRIFSCFMLFC